MSSSLIISTLQRPLIFKPPALLSMVVKLNNLDTVIELLQVFEKTLQHQVNSRASSYMSTKIFLVHTQGDSLMISGG